MCIICTKALSSLLNPKRKKNREIAFKDFILIELKDAPPATHLHITLLPTFEELEVYNEKTALDISIIHINSHLITPSQHLNIRLNIVLSLH